MTVFMYIFSSASLKNLNFGGGVDPTLIPMEFDIFVGDSGFKIRGEEEEEEGELVAPEEKCNNSPRLFLIDEEAPF